MPKSKKPAGGRAQDFDPRYGKKTSYQDAKRRPGQSSTGKPGSKSPNHRGHRPDDAQAPQKKQRWTAQERAGRDEARAIRTHRPSDERPARSYDDRPRRNSFDSDRSRPYDAESRPGRDDRRSSAAPRRDDRPNRSHDDRPRRDTGDRPYRADDRRDTRPARDDRPRRDSDRPQRSYDDRPSRSYDDRPRREFSSDRPNRSYDDRPRRDSDDRPRRSYEDRPQRDFRPARDDRPRRDATAGRHGDTPRSDDRNPARRDRSPQFGSDRPRRDNDRPQRSYDDRPRREFNGDRPNRSYDDRPRRDDRRDARPARSDWAHAPRGSAQRDSDAWRGRGETADQKSAAHEAHVDVVHERLQADAVDAGSVEIASFGDLGLGQNIVTRLAELGAASPFPIQAATVGPILEGRDVLARGRTGSGKTIAFGAPLVESILRSQAGQRREFGRSPKALILAPTRELALQIDGTVQALARSVGLFTTQVYGGVPQARQVGALKKGVDIVIGTPGRIEDLQRQGKLDLSEVRIVVLDEADHMSELGFLEPMQRILRLVEDGAQKLLFSATLDREVAALVDEFLVDPAVYEVAGETQDTGTIDHRVLVIDHRDKAEILSSLVDRDGKTLVFTRTRAYAEMLSEQFEDAGIAAVALHGDLNQARRTRNLQRLTDGKVRVLVATDVAARGIHVDDIDLVIQADAPDEYKTYLHRSGRTGRAGREGTVVTLVTRQRRRRMQELLSRAEIEAPFDEVRLGDDLIEELSGRQPVS